MIRFLRLRETDSYSDLRLCAGDENICRGAVLGGARVPVYIVTSDHVRLHVTSLLMSQLYFITKQSAPCSLCRLNIKFFSALFVSFLENWFYRLKEINSSALIMLVERYKIT